MTIRRMVADIHWFRQQEFDIRCEWGKPGLNQLAPISDVLTIVDVLSFSSCVDIAVSKGGSVYPYCWNDESAIEYARSIGAILCRANRESDTGYSLSPTSLLNIPKETRLVLPSPNGSTLSLATGHVPTLTSCLRNATAVGSALCKLGKRISVIPAGEMWEDGTLRPAIEDLIGAGAVISGLPGSRSPEAELAVTAFENFRSDMTLRLKRCGSGKELIGRGFEKDVELAAAIDVSDSVPLLIAGAYTHYAA